MVAPDVHAVDDDIIRTPADLEKLAAPYGIPVIQAIPHEPELEPIHVTISPGGHEIINVARSVNGTYVTLPIHRDEVGRLINQLIQARTLIK